MANILKGFFGQNKQPTDIEEKPIDTAVQTIKPAPLRGAGGKFVSKKPAEKKSEDTTQETPPKPTSHERPGLSWLNDKPLIPQTVTFYGHAIRKWQVNNTWYFSLVDIITITKVIDPLAYIHELEQNEKTKEIFVQNTMPITTTHDEKKEIHTCVTYENFMQLLPILRSDDCVFPGPFPDWLHDIAL